MSSRSCAEDPSDEGTLFVSVAPVTCDVNLAVEDSSLHCTAMCVAL